MGSPFFSLILALFLCSSFPCSSTLSSLTEGSSLSVEKIEDVLISENKVFSAGFYSVGQNAYCFSIWFTQPLHDGNLTVVWMANRDEPINGKLSKLSLLKTGNLVLTDAGKIPVWSTNTNSKSPTHLQLNDTGNLVLQPQHGGKPLWQSFNSPTDTLLPKQLFTKDTQLISSRSPTNYSSGFYKLYFDNDNVLRLLFSGLELSGVYWYGPWLKPWEANRSTYNNSRVAVLDSAGYFNSSDELEFWAADFGVGSLRRLTVDCDGNIRLYSLNIRTKSWDVSWQAISNPCRIFGICGANSLCTYHYENGRRCSCLPGYKMKNYKDWSYGCEPVFTECKNGDQDGFLQIPHSEFYGYDSGYFSNFTLDSCEKKCLEYCNCKGFQYKFDRGTGVYNCYVKTRLFNGYHSLGFEYPMYIKLPKNLVPSNYNPVQNSTLNCSDQKIIHLRRTYKMKQGNASITVLLYLALALGGLEIICMACFFYITIEHSGKNMQGYLHVATGFKRFTYSELKTASSNFGEEIGRGGSGVVYKGVLSDNRVAAIKRLSQANQGEAEFLAEVSTICRLNHMHLIETWGYCFEGKHRLLVYEYMSQGSLAEALHSKTLDWNRRYEIAVGTAKGLAYLHEECLEWVLHCDVKPHNILLGSNYEPKVADFGLSKLLNRGAIGNSTFSTIRGTRGYMAPEWVFNLPITSKVDVYSYGVVMLEMITGRNPMGTVQTSSESGEMEQRRLVSWVREKAGGSQRGAWVEQIVDPAMDGKYEMGKMKTLVKVAIQCVEEEKDARPTMSQVVTMLLHPEDDDG